MGLDITYYRNVALAPVCTLDDDAHWTDEVDHERGYPNSDFPGRAAPFPDAPFCYTGEHAGGFRAGSYSGYNQWRDWLARLGGDTGAKAVWAKGEASANPFALLVNFADNEGILGAETCAKLLPAFDAHAERAQTFEPDETGYFAQKYAEWHQAVRVAATESGFIDFH